MALSSTLKKAARALRDPVDPLAKQWKRVLRVAWERGYVGDMDARAAPALVKRRSTPLIMRRSLRSMLWPH